ARRVLAFPSADPPQGARARQEPAAAEGGRAVASPRGRARPEAWVLDSSRRLAPRRAGAVRARDALRRDASSPGVFRAGRRRAPAGRTRSWTRGPVAPDLGIARVHALARATCRRCPPRHLVGGAHGVDADPEVHSREHRRGGPRERLASRLAMRVWIDMTASAHPLVFRP